jgi:hypothetical protein
MQEMPGLGLRLVCVISLFYLCLNKRKATASSLQSRISIKMATERRMRMVAVVFEREYKFQNLQALTKFMTIPAQTSRGFPEGTDL